MKKNLFEVLKNRRIAGGITAIALAAAIMGANAYQDAHNVPELTSSIDTFGETSIAEDETPLASTTTTKTSTKTSTKKVTLSTAATKTYTKTLPTTTKTTTKNSTSKTATVQTVTAVKTASTEKYVKKSKVKTVTTKTTTTVKTTTTPVAAKTEVAIAAIAPKMDSRVLDAFTTLGFKCYIDPSVSYSGYFDAKTRSITLRAQDDTVYHELGHFLSFISGNTDATTAFQAIYSSEKSLYTGSNSAYVLQSSSEYYAESVRNYILAAGDLQSSRPQTYSAIAASLEKVTATQIKKIQTVYAAAWNS